MFCGVFMAIDSKKPGKQRKYLAEMPLHKKRKVLSGHLSKELRKELGKRSLPVKKGDTARVLRGNFKKSEGKITKVDYKKGIVFMEKVLRKRVDGKESFVAIQPSNLLIVDLERKDERRFGKNVSKFKKEKAVKE